MKYVMMHGESESHQTDSLIFASLSTAIKAFDECKDPAVLVVDTISRTIKARRINGIDSVKHCITMNGNDFKGMTKQSAILELKEYLEEYNDTLCSYTTLTYKNEITGEKLDADDLVQVINMNLKRANQMIYGEHKFVKSY